MRRAQGSYQVTSESADIVAFSADVLDFKLHPRQADILEAIYRDGIRTAVLRLGRRSGKGRMMAVIAAFEATIGASAHLAAVPHGEQVAIVVIATSQRQARVCHRYVASFLRRPALAGLIARESDDSIELTNGVVVTTLPCSAASGRGLGIAVLILDECAWFAGIDGSPLDVGEIYRGLVPATAQFPERRVILASTPRWAGDWFAQLCARAATGDDDETRVWHFTTAEMNPSISAKFLEAEKARDPVTFRREYEATFESGISAALDADLVRAAVRNRGDLPPMPDQEYILCADPAFTGDRFALIVGHRDREQRIIVDRVTAWAGSKSAPVQIDRTLDEIAAISQAYYGARCLIDQYAAEPIRQGLAARGLNVTEKPWSNDSKVSALASLRATLYSSRLDLPNHRELIAELVSLEQHPTASGRPRIAAPGRSHDDYASALMALVAELATDTPPPAGATIEPSTSAGYDALIALHAHPDRPQGFGLGSRRQRGISRILSR
jgi:hypothetical protein